MINNSFTFCFAKDKVTTPTRIKAQASSLMPVSFSPNRITLKITLVIGSKVVKIATGAAPTCLMPTCNKESATTVQSKAKMKEIIQALVVKAKVNCPVPWPKMPIQIADIKAM